MEYVYIGNINGVDLLYKEVDGKLSLKFKASWVDIKGKSKSAELESKYNPKKTPSDMLDSALQYFSLKSGIDLFSKLGSLPVNRNI